eukprot:jgi/Mesvir1/23356/Mv21051-RA.1
MEKTTVEAKLKECIDWFDAQNGEREVERMEFMLEVLPLYSRYVAAVGKQDARRPAASLQPTGKGKVAFLPDGWVTITEPGKESTITVDEARKRGFLSERRVKTEKTGTANETVSRGQLYDEFMLLISRRTGT